MIFCIIAFILVGNKERLKIEYRIQETEFRRQWRKPSFTAETAFSKSGYLVIRAWGSGDQVIRNKKSLGGRELVN